MLVYIIDTLSNSNEYNTMLPVKTALQTVTSEGAVMACLAGILAGIFVVLRVKNLHQLCPVPQLCPKYVPTMPSVLPQHWTMFPYHHQLYRES